MARFASLLVASALGISTSASAEVFKLYGELDAGGMYGHGLAGDHKDDAFSVTGRGGALGALFGARVLIFDAHVLHHQFINGGETETWTQFNAGLNFGFDSGGTGKDDKQKQDKGYFEMGIHVGFGLGTGAQVDPPLDNSEITDKGFVLQGQLGFGKHLTNVVDIGVSLPVHWAYMFKSGAGATANNTENQYQQIMASALLVLRVNIRLL